jgi:hypothetical protein
MTQQITVTTIAAENICFSEKPPSRKRSATIPLTAVVRHNKCEIGQIPKASTKR